MQRFINHFKLPVVLIIVFAMVWAVAGCGSSNNNASNDSTASNTSTNDSQASTSTGDSDSGNAPAKTVSITVWDKPHSDDPAKSWREAEFAKFDAKYPNIKVTHMEQTKGKEREQFITAVAGGEQPDAVLVAYPDMDSYIKQGIAADITDLWNQYPDKDNYLPSSLNAATSDGKIYGFPNDMYVTGLLYNKQLFKDAGLDPAKPPANWDEFVQYAQKLTDPAKNINGYDILGMDWADWFFEYYVWEAGGDLTKKNPDGTAELTFTSDAAVKALQFYKDLKWKYKVTQRNVVQSYDDNWKDFYTGHAGMIVGASDAFGGLISKGMDISTVGFAALPAGPSGKSPAQVGGNYWIINPKASPEQKQAAFTYASYFTSKSFQEDGLQYQKDNGIVPNLLTVRKDVDMTKYVDGIPADIASGVQGAAGNTHLEYFLKSQLSPYVVKAIQKVLLNENADPKTELQAAQDQAQKEVVDKYNAQVKK